MAHDADELLLELDPLLETLVHPRELRLMGLELVQRANQLLVLPPNLIVRAFGTWFGERCFDLREQRRSDFRSLLRQGLSHLHCRSLAFDRIDPQFIHQLLRADESDAQSGPRLDRPIKDARQVGDAGAAIAYPNDKGCRLLRLNAELHPPAARVLKSIPRHLRGRGGDARLVLPFEAEESGEFSCPLAH